MHLNAGSTSPYFKIERGVRQGDPLSPYLFILSLQMLAILIRDEPNIKGIQSHDVEIKLSLYADDVTGFLGDELSGHKFIEIVNMFGKLLGLELNMEKSMAKCLGSKRNSIEKPLLISWPDNPIKISGICFSYDEKECNALNFKSKIRLIIYQWRERDLTLIGRIQIIKTLIISQFQHTFSVIDIPEFYIKQIETIIYNFVRNEKRDKIKRSTLRKRKELVGLKAPDFRCIIQAAKLKCLFMLLNPDRKPWKSSCINLFSKMNIDIKVLLKSPSCFTIIKNSKIPDFYKDALKTWDMLLETTPYTRNDFLWYNKLFPIDDNAVFFK